MNVKLTMTILALATTGTMAMAQNLTLWRGETRTEILRDNTAVGVAPDGITVKVGTALPVRHLDRPQGTHYGEVADRVHWGLSAPGLKVVSVSVDEGVKPGEYSAGGLNIRVLDRVLPQPKDWYTSGAVLARRPPKMIAETGTPFSVLNSEERHGQFFAEAVKREFG